MKKRLVIANWKMYLDSPEEVKTFAKKLRAKSRTFAPTETWIAPSFILVPAVVEVLKKSNIKVGVQTVSPFDPAQGKARTGEVSAQSAKNAGAFFALVGHSERRTLLRQGSEGHSSSNETIHQELTQAVRAGLTVVLCVGETARPSTSVGINDRSDYFSYVEEQLRSALAGMIAFTSKIIIAYEPVWAIGKMAEDAITTEDLEEMVIFIKKTLTDVVGREKALKIPILYGGSVEPTNAAQLIKDSGVNGFLVGHASADADSFIEILKSCRK